MALDLVRPTGVQFLCWFVFDTPQDRLGIPQGSRRHAVLGVSLQVLAGVAGLRAGACAQEAVCTINTTSPRGMRKKKSPRSSLRVSPRIWSLRSDDSRPIKQAVPL